MRREICLCPEIAEFKQRLQPRTRVVVLMHHREAHLTTGTAKLAEQILPACEIHLRGNENEALDPAKILKEGETPLFLYPAEDAQVLSPEYLAELEGPFCLIVPDGSWRQASKVHKRETFLASVPRVVLKDDAPTAYKLRNEPKVGGLATFEAIARALGVLESPELREEMEKLFATMVKRTLDSRLGKTATHAAMAALNDD
jgi:DTW domain-containing protein YfiP